MAGAGADCDDLASEVFATAWRRWPAVPEDPLPWLLRTARNHLANHRRAQRRRAGAGHDPAPGQGDSPARIAEVAEEVRELLAAVDRLPELEREVLLLVAWDGLSAKQAARVVGCLAGTARARLYRARCRLAAERRANEAPPRHPPRGVGAERVMPAVEELRLRRSARTFALVAGTLTLAGAAAAATLIATDAPAPTGTQVLARTGFVAYWQQGRLARVVDCAKTPDAIECKGDRDHQRATAMRIQDDVLRANSTGQDTAVLFLAADGGVLACAGARACSYMDGEPNAGRLLPPIGGPG